MKTFKLFIILLVFSFWSCKTYTISTESFKEQFIGIDNTSLKAKDVNIAGLYNKKFYSNTLKAIIAVDKKNNKLEIVNSPSIEMRITTTENKRYIMYFDTVYIQNDILYSSKSRLLNLNETQIPFDKIVKIEIQDGRKNYKSIE